MAAVVVLSSQYMGRGSDKLGQKLMGSFLRKLWASENKPDVMLFYNSAVLLLAEGSAVLDALTGLSDDGVELVACGTCCQHFDISDRLEAGRISDMEEIVETMLTAEIVINV